MNAVKKVIAGVALTAAVAGGVIISTQPKQITVDITNSYELNSLGDGRTPGGPLSQLQDGITNVAPIQGYGKIISTSDEYWVACNDSIISVKLYSFQGSGQPWQLYAWYQGKETLLASFTGGSYMNWITYNTPARATKLHIISHGYWPTEWLITGYDYTSQQTTSALPVQPKIYLTDQFGVNTFPWSIQKPADPSTNNPVYYEAFKAFTSARLYVDWKKLEQTQGLNCFQQSLDGAWYIDKWITDLEAIGITPLLCFKTQPDWMIKTFPANVQNDENAPFMYAGVRGTTPIQYKEQARTAYQIALRYGKTVHPLSEATIDPKSLWNGFVVTKPLSGLGTLGYIENSNEPDRFWKTQWAYQTAWEYAANMSAFYDGDEGRLGKGYGVKTADVNMQVVTGGLAQVDAGYFRGMADWSSMHRKSLPYDILNIHCYALTKQPEGIIDVQLKPLVAEANRQGKPLWFTESGWDLNQATPNHVAPIGSKTAEMVQGDWIFRTALLAARIGIAHTEMYQDFDDNPSSPIQYSSMGLLNSTGRRIAAQYLYQAKQVIAGYYYVSTQMIVGYEGDKYSNGKKECYWIWSPTSTGRTANYNTGHAGTVYNFVIGGTAMKATQTSGVVNIGETPILYMPN